MFASSTLNQEIFIYEKTVLFPCENIHTRKEKFIYIFMSNILQSSDQKEKVTLYYYDKKTFFIIIIHIQQFFCLRHYI